LIKKLIASSALSAGHVTVLLKDEELT